MATIRQINNYPELRTVIRFNRIIQYLNTGVIHPTIQNQNRYIEKYGPNSGFIMNNNDFFFHPNNNINLEVVRPDQKDIKLQLIFDDEERGLGVGLTQFFRQVCQTYLNINKTDSDNFLKKQGDYQLGRTPIKKVNKPIRSQGINQIWSIDLVDMTAYNMPAVNHNYKYIFSCIDLFTGKYFARPIFNRNNNINQTSLTDALDNICTVNNTWPSIIKCDGEFAVGNIREYMIQHQIKIIKSRSHVPTDNSICERINREIRKKIRAGFIRHNDFAWVDHLQIYVNNINNQKKDGQDMTPNQMWVQGYDRNNNVAQPARLMANQPQRRYRLNDLVRISLYAIDNKTRQRKKQHMETYKTAIFYTPEIYRIFRTYNRGVVRRYALIKPHIQNVQENPNDQDLILMADDNIHYEKFYSSDLLSVETRNINDIVHPSVFPQTTTRALRLNKFRIP